MTTPYFNSDARTGALGAALRSWEGTPFRHNQAVRGAGVDCMRFVAAVYVECGLLAPGRIAWPSYSRDWHLHAGRGELVLTEVLAQAGDVFRPLDPASAPADGDLMLYRCGRAAAHGAIFYRGRIWHAVETAGVRRHRPGDAVWRPRLRHILRPYHG